MCQSDEIFLKSNFLFNKVSWLILSYIEDNDKRYHDKYETMVQRIETTLVNGRRATMTKYKNFIHNATDSNEGIFL